MFISDCRSPSYIHHHHLYSMVYDSSYYLYIYIYVLYIYIYIRIYILKLYICAFFDRKSTRHYMVSVCFSRLNHRVSWLTFLLGQEEPAAKEAPSLSEVKSRARLGLMFHDLPRVFCGWIVVPRCSMYISIHTFGIIWVRGKCWSIFHGAYGLLEETRTTTYKSYPPLCG